MKRGVMGLIGLALVASPVAAQLSGNDGYTLLKALKEGEGTKAVGLVESNGLNIVNYRGADGDAPLHVVTRMRNANWIGFLLANGADPNIAGPEGDTPLIVAARMGYTEGVTRYLQARADVDRGNKRGETALIVAVNQRQPAVVRQLLLAGADPNKQDFVAGYSARDYAKRETRTPELLRLIETVKRPTRQVAGPTRN